MITLTATETVTSSPTITAFPTFTPEPAGCLKPSDDYTHVKVNGWTINQRPFAMLVHAQELYGGELEIAGRPFHREVNMIMAQLPLVHAWTARWIFRYCAGEPSRQGVVNRGRWLLPRL